MTTRRARQLYVGLFVVLLGSVIGKVAPAQITTDRPGFADGAATVAPGTVQGEFGYAFTRESRTTVHELGQAVLRAGLTDHVELRGGVGSYVVGESEDGYDGASLGAKVTVLNTPTAALGAIATTTLPLDTRAGTSTRARQTLALAFDGALTNRIAFGVNSGASVFYSAGSQDERAPEGLFQAVLGGSLTASVDAFVGYAGFYGKGDNRSWIEGGITLLASPDLQFDVNGGVRADGNVDSTFFVGVGVAHRL